MWVAIDEWGCLSPFELTSQHHISWIPDIELQDLVFALLGFGLALIPPALLSMPPSLLSRMGMFTLSQVYGKYVTCFSIFTGAHK
jgi:uncharacterized membrane protein